MEAIFLNEQFTINISANIYLQALHNSKHNNFRIFKLKHGQLFRTADKLCYKIHTGTKKLSGCKSNEEKKQTNGKLYAILN